MEEQHKKNVDQPHSVKFGINAKGQFSAEVKCYGQTPEEALQHATNLAAKAEQIVRTKNDK